MTNNEKTVFYTGLGVGLVFGIRIGTTYARVKIMQQYEQKRRLVANCLITAVDRARRENMSGEEFEEALSQELEFIRITDKI